jgi:hypothetical protein
MNTTLIFASLQARNLIAERDRSIQIEILENTARDSFNMKVITVLTALFLPGTFMAVNLTSLNPLL